MPSLLSAFHSELHRRRRVFRAAAFYGGIAFVIVQVIDSASAGDVGAIYGFGFPPFLGGPYWPMDRLGLPALVEQLNRLAQEHGNRFTPAPALVQRAAAGEWYHPVN